MDSQIYAWFGLAAAVLFSAGLPMLIKGGPRTARVGSYLVPVYHISCLVLIFGLPSGPIPKIFGFIWIAVDTTLDIATLHGLDFAIIMPIRKGGHLFAGLWTLTAGLSMPIPIMIVGVVTGVALILDALVTGPAKLRQYIFYGSLLLSPWLFAVSIPEIITGSVW